MELIVPWTKPSRIFHDLCAYWLMSSVGSNANEQVHVSRRLRTSVPNMRMLRLTMVLATAWEELLHTRILPESSTRLPFRSRLHSRWQHCHPSVLCARAFR